MKLYDLLSSTDTQPMDKLRRNIPQWMNSFILVPLNSNGQLNCVYMEINVMNVYAPTVTDLLATDWEKF
jgi:hypothetical protein